MFSSACAVCLRFLVLLNLVTIVGQFIDVRGFFEFQFDFHHLVRLFLFFDSFLLEN